MPDTALMKFVSDHKRFVPLTETEKSQIRALISEESIDAQNDQQQTALMKAFERGDFGLALYLIELGADTNILDKNNKKAVDYFADCRANPDLIPKNLQDTWSSLIKKLLQVTDLYLRGIIQDLQQNIKKAYETTTPETRAFYFDRAHQELNKFYKGIDPARFTKDDNEKPRMKALVEEFRAYDPKEYEIYKQNAAEHQKAYIALSTHFEVAKSSTTNESNNNNARIKFASEPLGGHTSTSPNKQAVPAKSALKKSGNTPNTNAQPAGDSNNSSLSVRKLGNSDYDDSDDAGLKKFMEERQ
jgi:hypothetical protein